MKTFSKTFAVVVLLALAACGPPTRWDHTPREQHIVRTGETLYAIGFRYGINPRDLAYWNDIGSNENIYPGQAILLTAPAGKRAAAPAPAPTRTAQPKPSNRPSNKPSNKPLPPMPSEPSPGWRWPTSGKVAAEFGQRKSNSSGMLIAGKRGQPIVAAANGKVVYSGGGLIGYGNLIIVKHNETYLSAYGHNSELLVREGDSVRKGQRIATMGNGPGQAPALHFEIRRNGDPVNPRGFLPRS